MNCQNCQLLEARVRQLEIENQRLTKQLQLAIKIIKIQRNQLNTIAGLARDWIVKAQRVMTGHLPRGTYALWRGRLEVAYEVYKLASGL